MDVSGKEFIAICENNIPEKGNSVKLVIKADKMHLFDWDTQQSMGYPEYGRGI